MLLQHAGAATSSTTDICDAETRACIGDAECADCLRSISGNVDEYSECVSDYDYDDLYDEDGELDACSYSSVTPCCVDSISTNDCMGNNAFVGYYTCLASYVSTETGRGECSTITCSDDSGGDDEVEGDDDVTVTDGAVGTDET